MDYYYLLLWYYNLLLNFNRNVNQMEIFDALALTVGESVCYSAHLRLPWWRPAREKTARAAVVIEELGLEVVQCIDDKARPLACLKAPPGFQSLIAKIDNSAFNLNPVASF